MAEIMIEVVEEAPDVQIDHPVRLPAPFPACCDRVQRTAARPIARGVRVEHRLHQRLQHHSHHRLRDSVRDRGHTEDPDPASSRLVDLHHLDRRREAAARRHAIPQLVEVALQVCLELLDRLAVDARRTLVGLDPQVRLEHQVFRDLKRLRSARLVHPGHSGWPPSRPGRSVPFAPSALPDFTATTRRSAPVPRIGTRPLAVLSAWGSPSRRRPTGPTAVSGRQVPTFRTRARARLAPPPRTPSGQSTSSPRTCPGAQIMPRFRRH
jgi:hypothetical protein